MEPPLLEQLDEVSPERQRLAVLETSVLCGAYAASAIVEYKLLVDAAAARLAVTASALSYLWPARPQPPAPFPSQEWPYLALIGLCAFCVLMLLNRHFLSVPVPRRMISAGASLGWLALHWLFVFLTTEMQTFSIALGGLVIGIQTIVVYGLPITALLALGSLLLASMQAPAQSRSHGYGGSASPTIIAQPGSHVFVAIQPTIQTSANSSLLGGPAQQALPEAAVRCEACGEWQVLAEKSLHCSTCGASLWVAPAPSLLE